MQGAAQQGKQVGQTVEWPTLALIIGTYAVFGLVTWYADSLPVWAFLAVAALIGGFYGHLVHEIIHGHPTRDRRLNAFMV